MWALHQFILTFDDDVTGIARTKRELSVNNEAKLAMYAHAGRVCHALSVKVA
jgi:hypothetical protein